MLLQRIGLSSIEFKKDVKDFGVTTNQYANEKGDLDVDVYCGAIASIHGEYGDDGFTKAKIFTRKKTGRE